MQNNMVLLKQIGNCINNIICYLKRNQIINLKGDIIKVNIGSGLEVVPGWINVDSTPSVFIAKWPKTFHKIVFPICEMKPWYSEERYSTILASNNFIHHNIKYGIPFMSESINYIFSSHMLEHLFIEEARFFAKELHRVLKKMA